MVKLIDKPVYLVRNVLMEPEKLEAATGIAPQREHRHNTIASAILGAHNQNGDEKNLKIKFDALASHDITYVGIVQTARASGLERFPLPYVLTNCHNSLCAVGGTINEDDHAFGLSAAKKYGGIFVPPHQAVIHQYMRETMSGGGKMILGSDSHTRYGALGTMAVGEGGPELVKQLLGKTYDISAPDVIAVYLTGEPQPGVGPQDVALAIIGAVFQKGFVKNKVLEFVGPGISRLSVDFRNGIDVMTTETTCLSSIWETDGLVKEYYEIHGRPQDYKKLTPAVPTLYDGAVAVELDKVVPMIALPFHPSNVCPIAEVVAHPVDILAAAQKKAAAQLDNPASLNLVGKVRGGKVHVDQGIIAGCAGGSFENLMASADLLKNAALGSDFFALSVYPASQPIYLELVRNGAAAALLRAGANIKTAFCGPCFGAGDVPANNDLSIRHTTRNFPNREGSKPNNGQIASVALMDARSITATAINGGVLTPATEPAQRTPGMHYYFDKSIYAHRVYDGYNKADTELPLRFGPNIADWPAMIPLTDHVLLRMASVIRDPVTTTDELIPSGETSSYRSNPLKLAEFTLSRKDPGYVNRAKAVYAAEMERRQGRTSPELESLYAVAAAAAGIQVKAGNTALGSAVYAVKPGDGSAREQAASCQRVLGGLANLCSEYATKRYRSNLINWGMLPFTLANPSDGEFQVGDNVFVPHVRAAVAAGTQNMDAYVISGGKTRKITLCLSGLTSDEREIILSGCLINYYTK